MWCLVVESLDIMGLSVDRRGGVELERAAWRAPRAEEPSSRHLARFLGNLDGLCRETAVSSARRLLTVCSAVLFARFCALEREKPPFDRLRPFALKPYELID